MLLHLLQFASGGLKEACAHLIRNIRALSGHWDEDGVGAMVCSDLL